MINRLRKARKAYELGKRLRAALERARKLHPWVSVEKQFQALVCETHELAAEVQKIHGHHDNHQRVIDEAIDCAVVAIRIAERR